MLAPMPPILREAKGEYNVVDKSPLALAARAGEAAGFLRSLDKSLEIAKNMADPSYLDYYNLETATPEIMRIQNSPERWISTDKEVEGKRQVRQKAAAQKQATDALPAKAAIMKAQAVQAKAGIGQPQQQGAPMQQQGPPMQQQQPQQQPMQPGMQ